MYGLDFDYYRDLISPYAGILFILIGFGLVFFGNRLLFWLFGFIVLSFVSLGSFLFCYNLFISATTSKWIVYGTMGMTLVFGGFIAYVSQEFAE